MYLGLRLNLTVYYCHCEGGGQELSSWFCSYAPRGNLYSLLLSLRGGVGKSLFIGLIIMPPWQSL